MKTISITAKCSDMFAATWNNKEYDGYVPKWFPSQQTRHFGDYVELIIDLETGRILNWKKPSQEDLEETFTEEI